MGFATVASCGEYELEASIDVLMFYFITGSKLFSKTHLVRIGTEPEEISTKSIGRE